ncbi:MAG TPA: hypothetical protein VLA22_08350 [Gaiellaceae bacterium]|nr:hypothetical protein [Gaiellaceae bacterium]
MVIRLLIWDMTDSMTSLDELRERVPELELPSTWVWNDATERFGILSFGEDLPEAAGWAQDLIGDDPDVYEEFDSA